MIKNIFSVRAILAGDANRGRPQMPYAPEHKQQTRARIVECARRMFNRHGFEAVSIDQIMFHPDGTGARKKTARKPSANRGVAGTPRFIWLPRMTERP
jgi:hypothetical protein